jgi:phosphonatase-like hydrolase
MVKKGKKIKLAVFDMAGTTVDDRISGVPLVLKSYDDAFREYGVILTMDVLNEQRGRDKRTVIEEFGGEKAPKIYAYFVNSLLSNTQYVKEMSGSGEVFQFLKDSGVKIAVSTGFPNIVAESIVKHLRWEEKGLIDYWTCSELVGASRPNPAMILKAMKQFEIDDPLRVVKVDDTAKGIEEGLCAGVITIGVLTGTQSRKRLQEANPTDIIQSVSDLPIYLKEKNCL